MEIIMSYTRSQKNTHRRPTVSNSSDNDSLDLKSLFSSAFKSMLISFAISVVLAFGLCAIAFMTSDPMAYALPLSMASLYIPSFFAGFLCSRFKGSSALICGLLSGGMFMLLYMFLSLFLPREMSANYTFFTSAILHLLIAVFSVFGAYIGLCRPKKKRRIRR